MLTHNYKKLEIWNKGIELTSAVYDYAEVLPEKEKYGLWSQMTRCAVSIPSNIAEGSARKQGAFKQFLRVALGSAFELETQLIICKERQYGTDDEIDQLQAKVKSEQKMIYNFLRNLPEDRSNGNYANVLLAISGVIGLLNLTL